MTLQTNINPNAVSSETQKAMILEALLLGHKLTVLDGLTQFGCFSLSQRISELNAEDWNIKKTMIKLKSGKWVMQYSLYEDFKE